jgi:hypothetical protein
MEAMGQITSHYLIVPRKELTDALRQAGSDLARLLAQPSLWTKTYGHRSAWRRADCRSQVKLLFLASLKMDYGHLPEFRELVGELQVISIDIFDARWVLRDIHEIDVAEYVASELVPDVVASIQETGNPLVDRWIAEMKAGAVESESRI